MGWGTAVGEAGGAAGWAAVGEGGAAVGETGTLVAVGGTAVGLAGALVGDGWTDAAAIAVLAGVGTSLPPVRPARAPLSTRKAPAASNNPIAATTPMMIRAGLVPPEGEGERGGP